MSISKSQLNALNNGLLDAIGKAQTPDLDEGGVMEKALFNIAEVLVEDLRKSATAKDVVASKRLRSSIAPTPVMTTPDAVEVTIVMDKQWRFAERGRKAGKMPPIKSIEEWITEKGIRVKGPNTLKSRRSLAFAIAKKIGKKGTIKRFRYKGSKFIASVMTKSNVKKIAEHLAELQGRKIELYFKVE